MLIVVLDKWGFLVDDAQITLEVTKPSNETLVLTSQSGQIFKTENIGVYETSLLTDEIGKYSLYAQVELEDMVVDITSFFNVVDRYPFDIIRDVPVTIDPWLGPFRNDFDISNVDSAYDDIFNFTEVFSSDFEINDTNAHIIETINDTTYLKWVDIRKDFIPYYVAQTPLVTPYLYYLGNSWIDSKIGTFYENRSWLFAIDPVAKSCGFESPCICGGLCGGGGEPGSGTIDTCSDGNTNYEYINDIRVTNLNGDYFGVGDTVEVCFDYQCDTSGNGDLVSFAYKNGGSAWVDGDIYNEIRCDNNNLNTFCSNIVLDNYVGTHHIRGKLVWEFGSRPSNRICDTDTTYRDHDDLEFNVLDKVAPTQLSWNLYNGTDIGNNLIVIRGKMINTSVQWDLPLQEATIFHDASGIQTNYVIDSYENNQTNYSFDTSNTILFPDLGNVLISNITSNDLYFNITGSTSGTRNFDIFAELRVNQTTLIPNVGYSPLTATMACQFTDYNVLGIPYGGVNVNFYQDGIFLGSNITNSSGWAQYSFIEPTIGNYNITC
ncbi:MAG: hypothetical protein VX028_04430, partial [Nanoarchaeota archaeon]|nr:hypothetical protein [Nanoarchaeota archaeon]